MSMRKRSYQPPPIPVSSETANAPVPGGGFKIARFPKASVPSDTAAAPLGDAHQEQLQTDVDTIGSAIATASGIGPIVDRPAGKDMGFVVSLDRLQPHPWNARIHRSAARIKEMSLQLSTDGQEAPILVTKDPSRPGNWFIVDGETRYKGAQKLGWAEMWALERAVNPNDPKEFYAVSFERTDSTEPISQIDQGLRWAQLVSEGHASLEWLAERLDRSKATISMMLSYARFPAKVTDFMAENGESFPYSVAAELARHLGDTERLPESDLLALVGKIAEDNVSRRGIEALVRQFVKAPGTKRERKAAVVNKTIKRGDAQVGTLREYGNGQIELKLQPSASLAPETKQALLEILEATVDALNSGDVNIQKALLERISTHKSDL